MRHLKIILAAMVLCATGPIAARAQISGDAIKIGILTDMSSVYADTTGMGSVVAAQMAAEDMGGKIDGHPIVVVYADHQNKPDTGAAIVRQWIDTEHVGMVGDVPTSSVALAVQQIVRERNKVFLMSGAGSSDLTGRACSPNGIQWTYDTYAQANVAARAVIGRGGKSWYFVTADYAFGQALERDATAIVTASGGKVLGSVKHPLNTADFSSFLLQAQGSQAQVIGLANAGGDAGNAIKQAAEFGLQASGQTLVPLLIGAGDIHAIGLQTAAGIVLAEAWYWDLNDETRAFSKRFMDRQKHMPSAYQAGMYSATLAYLKAIAATGTDDAKVVIAKMKATPVDDMFTHGGVIREDGRMVHDYYLFQVKKLSESKGEWDLYTLLATVPAKDAFRPIDQGGCPVIAK